MTQIVKEFITGRTGHQQVSTTDNSGNVFFADVGVLPILELLWLAGIKTTFSCQGNNSYFLANVPQNRAYVSMNDDAMTARFLTAFNSEFANPGLTNKKYLMGGELHPTYEDGPYSIELPPCPPTPTPTVVLRWQARHTNELQTWISTWVGTLTNNNEVTK